MKSAKRETLCLGRTSSGADLDMSILESPASMLLTGITRSGKTNELYNLIDQLRALELPVMVAGIDPSGIIFNAIGESLGGSEFRVSTLSDVQSVRAVLNHLVDIMDERIKILLKSKRDKFMAVDYTPVRPFIIVLLEEFPGMMAVIATDDAANARKPIDRIEPKIRASVQRIAMEGTKVGVTLWVVAQRADAAILSGPLRAQLPRKISFRQDSDGLRMIHTDITPEQIQQAQTFKPGQAYAEFVGELPLTRFRADYLPYEKFVARFE